MLPKTSAICRQFRKCGKPGCKCNAGDLHGPYFFYFYRENGRLRKKYIRKADAAALWEDYTFVRAIEKNRRDERRRYTELCRELRRFDREFSELVARVAKGDWQ